MLKHGKMLPMPILAHTMSNLPSILAIETSSELASAALLYQGKISSLQAAGVQNHSQHILPMVQQLLREASLSMRQLHAIAFGAGPGSFTGVRTACGIAQGLAFASQLPVLPLVTLKAMAQACFELSGADNVLAILDARMGQVYCAQYVWQDQDWQIVQAPSLLDPAQVVAIGTPLVCGQVDYALPNISHLTSEERVLLPSAQALLGLAELELAQGKAVTAALAQPIYLRNNVAQTSAERAAGKAAQLLAQQTQMA